MSEKQKEESAPTQKKLSFSPYDIAMPAGGSN